MSNRRDVMKNSLALACSGAVGVSSAREQQRGSTIIQRENAKEGSTDWQLTRVRPTSASGMRTEFIEGYCRSQSVAAGETLEICVSSNPVQDYKLEIFRTGVLSGKGGQVDQGS